MDEQDFLDAMERITYRVGVRPVLEALADWLSRGIYLDVLKSVADLYPEGAPDAPVMPLLPIVPAPEGKEPPYPCGVSIVDVPPWTQ